MIAVSRSRCSSCSAGSSVRAGNGGPGVGVDRQLAVLPRPASSPDRGLQDRELVRPGGEAALEPVLVELAEDRAQRIIGALRRRDPRSSPGRRRQACRGGARARTGRRGAAARAASRRPPRARQPLAAKCFQPGTRLRLSVDRGWGGALHRRHATRPIASRLTAGPASSGARIRTARCGGQPRSTSSSNSCRSTRRSAASRSARSAGKPALSRRCARHCVPPRPITGRRPAETCY